MPSPRTTTFSIVTTALLAVSAAACPIPLPQEKLPSPAPNPAPAPPVEIDADEHRLVARTLREAIARTIVREAKGGERKWGKVVITNELGEELATVPGLTLVTRHARGGRKWIDARNTADHPQILMYRIRWFNGRWSKWFIPGVNDRDWKDTTGRVWRYFTDHEHAFITIEPGGPLTTRQQFIGFDP